MIAENMAALFVFAWGAGGIALGYILRNYIDGARSEWEAYAYRRQIAHARKAGRRANDSRR